MGQQSMVRLSREDIEKSLPTGWRVEGNYLVRDLEFKTFMDCIAL